ncbi:hypothetical protein SMICM304S_09646 [Streptomyces microflavus]
MEPFTWKPPMIRPTMTGIRRIAFSRVATRQLRGENRLVLPPAGSGSGACAGDAAACDGGVKVTPLGLHRGALVASPHSTNNLSASAPTLCRIIRSGP